MKSAIPLTLLLAVASAYGEQQSDTYGENLGTVHFPCSICAAAAPQIERGVALLHHMTYEGAEAAFAAATKTDPGCAMGYWGMAMPHIHPLWPDVPSAAQMEKGMELIAEAKAQKQITAREHAYIAALESYYKHGPNQDEKVRLGHFDAGWEKVHEQFPDDLEAAPAVAAVGFRWGGWDRACPGAGLGGQTWGWVLGAAVGADPQGVPPLSPLPTSTTG